MHMMSRKAKAKVILEACINIRSHRCFCSSTSFPAIPRPTQTAFLFADPKTLSKLLKRRQPVFQLNQIHAQMIIQAFCQYASLVNSLIRSYISSNNVGSARILFESYRSPSPPTLLWNLMIRAYSKTPNSQESLVLFRLMLALEEPKSAVPDDYTFTFVITSCSHQSSLVCGESVHGRVIKNGYESNLFVGNSLVNLYSVFARMEDAKEIFNQMAERDVFTWTCLLTGYAKCGEMGIASNLFGDMPERNDVSWAVIVSGHVGRENYIDALRYFHYLLCDGKVKPNEAVLVCALSACAHLGALNEGKWIHIYIGKSQVLNSSNISTALIDMYAKCGRIDCAKRVFMKLPKRDVPTFTSMISGLSIHGLGKEALQIFSQMLAEGVKPNTITVLGVLNGCSHSGLVTEGCSIFNNMEILWGIVPKIEHFGCFIDLLARAGYLERAFEVAKSMPMEPDIVVWRAVLSACRIHGDINLGEQIIDHLSQLDSYSNPGGQVLLMNLNASLGRRDGISRLRKLMSESGIHSNPGCSWIEVDGFVHEFRVADQLHPRILEIREKLSEVLKRASIEGGYVANTRQVSFDLSEEEKEQAVSWHSEKLAIAFGLISTEAGASIRIVKNLRTCEDCHSAMKAISRVFVTEIVMRDRSRFHTFKEGSCSCNDYW